MCVKNDNATEFRQYAAISLSTLQMSGLLTEQRPS